MATLAGNASSMDSTSTLLDLFTLQVDNFAILVGFQLIADFISVANGQWEGTS